MNHSGIHIKRNEYPGERWLFVKVYGSPTICDRLVAEALCPKLNRMRKAGLASRWFFVRFSDPGYHLRLRIELNHPALQVDVLNSINKSLVPLCEERLLHKLSIDTYERELERYGSRHMDLTETLFCIDSECISKILGVLCHRGIESERWKLAFAIADRMMDAFDLSVNEKRSLSGDMSRAYLREFGFNEHNINPHCS